MISVLRLLPLTSEDAEQARVWRNDPRVRPGLRTTDMVTREQQRAFAERLLADRSSPHRYWSVVDERGLVGMAGLTDIRWADGCAEISLLLDPDREDPETRGQAVELVLVEAFDRLRLLTVYAECYESNPAIQFWNDLAARMGAPIARLPRRKWWDGRLWDSQCYAIAVDAWRKAP